MAADLAFLFPGQGAQFVGMGKALVEAFPEAAEVFAEADRAFGSTAGGVSLSELVFTGPDERLVLTEHAQPAIVATSVAAHRVLQVRGCAPAFVAGHSLGEYSAHVAAGTLSLADTIATVRSRGRYMQEAVPLGTGAMVAILGAELDLVTQACNETRGRDVVSPANINAPGQVVIAGHAEAVRRASERAKALGARKLVPLPVSAPFHCALMRPAEDRLAPELRSLTAADPSVPVVANVDASPKVDRTAAIDALIRQVSAPVLWQSSIERLVRDGVRTFVEVGPGAALSGLVKKITRDARIVRFGTPDELEGALEACSA
jgi:[acyl-carrier-protein] S-malonyltransferase